jgi:hypothetical protein
LETGQFYFNLGVTFGEKIGAAIFFSSDGKELQRPTMNNERSRIKK